MWCLRDKVFGRFNLDDHNDKANQQSQDAIKED